MKMSSRKRIKNQKISLAGFLLMFLSFFINISAKAEGVTIIDSRHYSHVFGEVRNYRIFLPPGYYSNPAKKYPVIYFLHGWSQRYFGSGAYDYGRYDKGDDNKGDNIENFVATHDVIVVKSDGYNRSPGEEYYVRPYNIGKRSEVETYRQFPIYYPEFINYIDATYNTIADREHRAISGLSMGGFMAYLIGGKYPQLFSAVGNFCGSTEFFVGPKDFPANYRHMDMYKNYGGMNVLLNYGDKDFIRAYHADVNKIWTQVMDNYQFKIYEGEHSTWGICDMYSFFLKTFADPPQKPARWSHADVYPVFSVWDYTIVTDRNIPGFTVLDNVDIRGFRCAVKELLPDGELFPFVNVTVTTPPIYEKNQAYTINDFDGRNSKTVQYTVISDNIGRLKISLTGSLHEIGINKKADKPNICIASFGFDGNDWITSGKDVNLVIKLLNKGLSTAKNIKVTASATRANTEIVVGESTVGNINTTEMAAGKTPFTFHLKSDTVDIVQFKISIQDDQKNQWTEFVEIPVKREFPEIKDFVIADGKIFTVAKAGVNSETILLGSGNGDGVANPGESIVILVKEKDTYRRTRLQFSDKYLNPFGVNSREGDDWMPYDANGVANKYTVPLIASDCPENHKIEFLAEYWLPDYPMHIIRRGKIAITVKGKDTTPPKLKWVQIPGDNIIQVKLYDGSKIQSVKARFVNNEEPSKYFDIQLKDDGLGSDRVEGDNVFSSIIPPQNFSFNRVIIEAADSFNNKLVEESPDVFLLH